MVTDKHCRAADTVIPIFLTSTRNAEPLEIMNDGDFQRMRVRPRAGLGTKHLARENSRVLVMIGSDSMARSCAAAIKFVRPIEAMRVFSPTNAIRGAYAATMTEKLDVDAVAMDLPEKALKGVDIVALTTDSLIPVVQAERLEPDVMYVNNVRNNEVGPDVLQRAIERRLDKCGRIHEKEKIMT